MAKERPNLYSTVLHAVRIEQPSAEARSVRERTDKLLGVDKEDDYKKKTSIGALYITLERLEDQELIRSEERVVFDKEENKETKRLYFFTTDKGVDKDKKYLSQDASGNTEGIPVFVPK